MSQRNDKYILWSTGHAFVLLLVTLFYFYFRDLRIVVLVAFISFAILIYITRPHWTLKQQFGYGNSITLTRLLGFLILTFFYKEIDLSVLFIGGLLFLIGDGIDGWIAHRFQENSEFGEYLDKETDALFVHLLCLIIIGRGLMGSWVIIIGLLRYLFAIFTYIYPTEIKKERRSTLGRYIYFIVVVALLTAFLPIPLVYEPLITISALLLFYSFGRDILWILLKS